MDNHKTHNTKHRTQKQAKTETQTHLAHEGDAVKVESLGALLRRPEFHEGVLVVHAAGHHRVARGRVQVHLKTVARPPPPKKKSEKKNVTAIRANPIPRTNTRQRRKQRSRS